MLSLHFVSCSAIGRPRSVAPSPGFSAPEARGSFPGSYRRPVRPATLASEIGLLDSCASCRSYQRATGAGHVIVAAGRVVVKMVDVAVVAAAVCA